jgi:hypothetical protein
MRGRHNLHHPPLRDTLCRALELAEQAVAAYYAISPREWSTRFRYDTAAGDDHPQLPFHPGALAQIVQLEPGSPDRPPRYRIVLKDEEIVALGREHGLFPVLAYTLAHELVHLVRFGSKRVPFELPPALVDEEERTVRRITRETLRPLLGPEDQAVVEQMAAGDGG